MMIRLEFLIILLFVLTEAQRSIVLKSWFGTGAKNVKYETVANNAFTKDGNIVPQTANARVDLNGRTIYDCTDIMGRIRRNGEEYERPNHKFKYKCDNGIERITACIGTERTGKALIKVGETFTKDGFWHKCTHYANNETAIYAEEAACEVNNKLYHISDEIRSEFFVMKCSENGYKIIDNEDNEYNLGCYYIDKDKMIDMKPDTVVEVNNIIHHCENNNDNIQYYTTGINLGCYISKMDRDLELGDSVVDKQILHRCYAEGDQIKYEEYPCGFKNTPSCEVPQRMKIPTQIPTISKPNSGFGTFSIAQLINRGSDKVISGPNTMKLELKADNR
uniref:Abnormal cell migration protein 18-like fibronectin type I domain-containing protein n=1 Tax=Setaria digitata TaxID=48799 RepID=A0A915PGU6_9BILA